MARDRGSCGSWGWTGGAGKGLGRWQLEHHAGAIPGGGFPRSERPEANCSVSQINGVPSEDMSLADTQQLIERTEGTLTLLVLRDNRQFLVNIADIDDSQSDSSRMDGEGTW